MLTGKLFEVSILLVSFLVVVASYLLVVWKDHSWINWATPALIITLGTKYFFQFLYLYNFADPGGSHYAYAYCYTTYGLSFLVGAVVYAFVKPVKLKQPGPSGDLRALPWLLLLLGFLLYLPILIEFRAYLFEPRRIYALTRTGYGLYFFGSTTIATLGFITFLFKRGKTFAGAVLFFGICTLLAYWHGSKGQVITYLLVWMLYRVYVDRVRINALAASLLLLAVTGLVIGSFVLFSSTADVADLAESVTTYADYVRNAMLVIDDPYGTRYYGRLMFENELYSRVPRFIMPSKPEDFGSFLLAKTYYPASYRVGEGAPAFDIGLVYADFGPLSIILICIGSALSALFVSTLVQSLRHGARISVFIVFLFMIGVGVISLSGTFVLPESIALGGVVTGLNRLRLLHARS